MIAVGHLLRMTAGNGYRWTYDDSDHADDSPDRPRRAGLPNQSGPLLRRPRRGARCQQAEVIDGRVGTEPYMPWKFFSATETLDLALWLELRKPVLKLA
jgi:hypothetical protein